MNSKRLFCFFTMLFSLLLASCDRDNINPGEVALVNGRPITLKQLQAAHDALVLGGDNPGRAVERLRMEYGAVLSDLIVQELVSQELEKRNLAVTDAELAEAEADLRSDFLPGEFERMLLEDSIDVEQWRNFLRQRLGMQKFQARLLRLQVSISAEEVEEFYLKHEEDFKVPERLHFIQVSGLVREQIAAACEQFRQTPDPEDVQAKFKNLTIRMVVMREDRLAPELVEALAKMQPMQPTPVIELNGEYVSLILLGREEARLLSREEIYSRIESIMLETKTQSIFEAWLENKIAKSTIKVSVHLLPENLQ